MFNDRAGEAIDFYVSIFNDARVISSMPGPGGTVMGGTFELAGQRFMAFNGGPSFAFSQGISQMISCETQDEIDRLYEKLSEGGQKQQCGWVTDKFGVSWQVIPPLLGELLADKDRAKANRVMQAMLGMHKINIQELKDAAGQV